MGRAAPILLLALAAGGCACQDPPAPVVTSVAPAQAPNDRDTALVVRGANFLAAVTANLDSPALSQVSAGFALGLAAPGGQSAALSTPTLVSDQEIDVTLPAGAAPARYDLHLVDPRGRLAVLASALLVYTPSCSTPPAPDGAPCNDGNLCTQVDTCQAGVCVGSSPVVCAPLDACHLAGTCAPATGLCSNPAAPDGIPCRSACTSGETCQGGACTRPPGGCANTAPLALLSLSPLAVPAGSAVTFDASASSDLEDPTSALAVQFDYEGTGLFSPRQPATQTSTHAFAAAGAYRAWVRVTDTGGLSSYASAMVLVAPPADLVLVTTALDESDPGATPASPGGTGLSLREAVTWANLQATPKVITFAPRLAGMTVAMTGAQRNLTLGTAGSALAGEAGVTVDFGGYNQPCLTLDAPDQILLGLTMVGCAGNFVLLSPRSQGSQVAYCSIGPGPSALGVAGQASSPNVAPPPPPASRIGPGNDLAGLDTGVKLTGTDYLVVQNRVRQCKTGASVAGVRARLLQNRIYLGASPSGAGSGVGLSVSQGPSLVGVYHNVFDGNGSSGVVANAIPLEVRNNLFTGNAGWGLDAPAADFNTPGGLGPNGFFGNASGAVSTLPAGATDVLLDPLYVNRNAGDFRLLPGSPAVDGGASIYLDGATNPLDVNGPAPGTYNGLAPDLGSEETPYTR